jgi:hypothetical protein
MNFKLNFVNLFLLLLAAPVTFSQTLKTTPALSPEFKLPRFERSFGVAYEIGGNFSFSEDQQNPPPSDWSVKTRGVNGCSAFYEQQVNKNNWGYSIGIGVSALFAEYEVAYRNPEIIVETDENGQPVNTINFAGPMKEHSFRPTAMPIMLDIPLNVSYAIPLKQRGVLRNYAGLKIRNIVYFAGELPEQTTGLSLGQGLDTTYKGSVTIAYATKSPARILATLNYGVKYSYRLKNGGGLNCFIDYNIPVFNQVKVRLSNFRSTELVSQYNPDENDFEQVNFNFHLYKSGWPYGYVGVAFKMSTFRIGFSYSLPEQKEK